MQDHDDRIWQVRRKTRGELGQRFDTTGRCAYRYYAAWFIATTCRRLFHRLQQYPRFSSATISHLALYAYLAAVLMANW